MAAEPQIVKLESCDEQKFDVPIEVIRMSETVKHMIEDTGGDQTIPLPNVTGKILEKVLEYCKHHVEHPTPPPSEEDAKKWEADKRLIPIIPWDADFCKVENNTLFELILAANYLDIKPLLDLTCKTLAGILKGKTPQQMRDIFGIKNDFTPEEEEQVRKDNDWCIERTS